MEKVIPDYPDYLVTDAGKVISLKFGKRKVLKNTVSQSGYTRVNIRPPGEKGKTIEVHRLVALTFIKRPRNKEAFIVNHKNGKKSDNRVSNLEWVTPKGNSHHYVQKLRGAQQKQKAKKTVETNKNTMQMIKFLHEKCDDPKMFQNLVGTILEG
jgi:hypothetical protein